VEVRKLVELANIAGIAGMILSDVSINGDTLLNDLIIAIIVVLLMGLLLRTPWYRS
jgi:hypothetical protein